MVDLGHYLAITQISFLKQSPGLPIERMKPLKSDPEGWVVQRKKWGGMMLHRVFGHKHSPSL